MGDDQVVLGIAPRLDVVTDDPCTTTLHLAGIGIGLRELAIGAFIKFGLDGLQLFHL
jgi:hypothetical protein